MRKLTLTFLLAIWFVAQCAAQNPTTTFAPWKNNAKGAYTIVHDDFGESSVSGIENYADTIAFNRGIKFTFGAITGSCNASDWVNANRMVSHGHEVMNHTHNHYCAYDPGWCPSQTWGSFATELDQSTNLIKTNTNVYPRFFIWPYDLHTVASKNHLRDQLNYYGARGGTQNQTLAVNQLNDVFIPDFMSINFSVFAPTTNVSELNGLVDLVIAQGKWGMRETHGVGDASWGSITVADYRTHMNYLRSKMLTNDVWVATATEVTTYKMQAQNFVPTTTYSAANQEIRINWNSPSIDLTDLRSDVTINVNLDGLTGYVYIYQANTQITAYTTSNGILSFNAFPHKGEILIKRSPWAIFPPGPFTASASSVCTNQNDVPYAVPPIAGATFIWSYSGSGALINGTGNAVTVNYSSSATSGTLSVKYILDGVTSPSLDLAVTVNAGYQVQGATRCGAGLVTLQVLTTGQYEWYSTSSGGSVLSTSQTYQPTVSSTTTFYTQRQTQTTNYSLGKASQGTANRTTIWWFPDYAQKFTISKSMKLTSVRIWGTGITNGNLVFVRAADGTRAAQSTTFNCSTAGTVVSVNVNLSAGTYYVYIYTGTAQGTYEGNITTPFTTAGVGSFENKLYNIAVNTSDIMSVTGTINNVYGPLYDFKFTETISDPCPRMPVNAVINNVPLQPAAFTTASSSVCQGQAAVSYQVPAVSGTTYAWSYTGTGATITPSAAAATIGYNGTATSGVLSVVPSNTCGAGPARTLSITVNALPAAPSAITGPNSVCTGATASSFSVTPVTGITYAWSYSGTAATLTPSGASTTAAFGTTATSGNISVTANNACGSSVATSKAIIVNSVPAQPGVFTQSAPTVCTGTSSYTYEVPALTGVTYNWTYSGSGATITPTAATAGYVFATGATPGNVSVTPSNACGSGTARSIAVTLNSVPTIPTIISGPAAVCVGIQNSYSVSAVTGVTYSWTYAGTNTTVLPSGAASSVTHNAGASSANLTVTPSNLCGVGPARSLAITVATVPAAPSGISGALLVCEGTSNVNYSIPAVSGLTYNWSYSGASTNLVPTGSTLQVNYGTGATSGNLSVSASNSCGTGPARTVGITVNTAPAVPSLITGSAAVCAGASGVNYSVTAVSGLTYNWSYTGSSAAIVPSSAAAQVNYGSSATSGNLSVSATNSCGTGTARTLAITVNTVPAVPSLITGSAAVCAGVSGVNYSVTAISGLTYNWSYTGSSAAIVPSSSTAQVNFGSSATSGNLSVSATNSCGTGAARSLAITVNTVPAQPSAIVAINANPCKGSTGASYSITAVSGVNYNWSYSATGASINGNSDVVTVDYSAAATNGNLLVSASNGCGTGPASILAIALKSAPAQPANFVTSAETMCELAPAVNFAVPVQTGVTYQWSYTGTGVQWTGGGSTILASAGNPATSGVMSVTASNNCGVSPARSIPVTVLRIPVLGGALSGVAVVCQGQQEQYLAELQADVTYNWSYTGAGVNLVPSANSAQLQFGNAAVSGSVLLSVSNACGSSNTLSRDITVNTIPTAPSGFVLHDQSVTQGDLSVLYSVANVSGLSYNWSFSGTDAVIAGTGAQVAIDFGLNATSGTLSVSATNSCGSSAALSEFITVAPLLTSVNGSSNTALMLSPNPCAGITKLEYVGEEGALSVFNMQGELVYEAQVSSQFAEDLNLSDLASGVYQVTIYSKGILYTDRLVIRR